jgi:hypothetical protein
MQPGAERQSLRLKTSAKLLLVAEALMPFFTWQPVPSGEMSDLTFTDAEWQGIEAACGWALSKTLRENILRVTGRFLSLEIYQQTGATLPM